MGRWIAWWLLVPGIAAAAPVAPNPPAADQSITLPASSAASVGGADATLKNPAGLSYAGGLELDYLHQRSVANDRVADGAYLAAAFSHLALGFSMEWVRFGSAPGFRRTTYALALGGEKLSLGTAFHIYGGSASPVFDDLTSWDVGLELRPWRFLALGAAILDVDAPNAAGVELPRRYDVGLALRPFGEHLTLTADLQVDDRAGWDDAAMLYALQWRVIDGFTLFGGATHYFNEHAVAFTAGIQLDSAHLGLGYAAGADSDFAHFDHTIGLRLSTERYPDLKVGSRVAVLDLDELLSPESRGVLSLVLGGHAADPYLSTLALLRRARDDSGIQGVVLEFGDLQSSIGAAHVEELRSQIASLRAAGKPVMALLTNSDDADYFLATACDKIYVVPEATLLINGLSWDTLFLGEALSRIGVRVEVARVGAYKNAPDQLTRADMSPEQAEAETAFLKTVYAQYESAATGARKVDAAKFTAAISKGVLTPQQAKDAGLIDGTAYPDELGELFKSLVGGKRVELVRDYAGWNNAPDRWGGLPQLALVRISGDIVEGKSSSSFAGTFAGAETIVRGIQAAAADDAVRAIVVRVDSPGGSGNASSLIERALEKARASKPVVVSMGNTAASGGYYVAVGGDQIWAEPTTLTGSIGVFVLKPDLSGLLQKISVHDVTLKQGESADIFNFTQPWTAAQQAAMQGYADAFYDRFITLVAERRKLAKDAVDKIARGRIWSGADARKLGLVDQLGSLDDAIRDAKRRAGLDPNAHVELETYGNPSELLPVSLLQAATRSDDDITQAIRELGLESSARELLRALRLSRTPGALATLPFSYSLR